MLLLKLLKYRPKRKGQNIKFSTFLGYLALLCDLWHWSMIQGTGYILVIAIAVT